MLAELWPLTLSHDTVTLRSHLKLQPQVTWQERLTGMIAVMAVLSRNFVVFKSITEDISSKVFEYNLWCLHDLKNKNIQSANKNTIPFYANRFQFLDFCKILNTSGEYCYLEITILKFSLFFPFCIVNYQTLNVVENLHILSCSFLQKPILILQITKSTVVSVIIKIFPSNLTDFIPKHCF